MNESGNHKPNRFLIGPAVLVTAAFIGPGTVTTASIAGANFGCALLWAVVFACVTTIVLQEMAARLGIVSQAGLGKALSQMVDKPIAKTLIAVLVVTAILIGNAAYQTGNILGAVTGIEILQQPSPNTTHAVPPVQPDQQNLDASSTSFFTLRNICIAAIGLFASTVVWIGQYKTIQKLLTILVISMSVLFILAACLSQPSLNEIAMGLIPRFPTGSEWFVVGLIGTTVVPYNLFLHASLAAQEWPLNDQDNPSALSDAALSIAIQQSRRDTILSVVLGSVVTCAILLTASSAFEEVRLNASDASTTSAMPSINAAAVAKQLEPVVGSAAQWLYAIGLFAAGLTSAITAPIAAAYAAAGCFGWPNRLTDVRLKFSALLVIAVGVVVGIAFGNSPQQTIILAQVTNGILLPVLAILLLIAANQSNIMRQLVNGRLHNTLAIIVILIVILIAVRQFYLVYEKLSVGLNLTDAGLPNWTRNG